MEHLFIINPAAGKRDQTETYREIIHRVCDAKHLPYSIAVSAAQGDCTRIAREAVQKGTDLRIYACGGDGTLNEVMAGVAGFPNVAVTSFCGGSGNDFLKIFGDVEPFRDLEQLLDCREDTFDLMTCNGEYAVNICSVGLDARVGTSAATYKRLPLVSGPGSYLLSALVNVIKGVTEPYEVEINGEHISGDQTMICVASGQYYGGGFHPVPDADPADGLLDVLVVKPVSRLQIAAIIGKYKDGKYAQYPQLIRHYRTKKVVIDCPHETVINMDGELRKGKHIEIAVASEKMRFFYPKQLSWRKELQATL